MSEQDATRDVNRFYEGRPASLGKLGDELERDRLEHRIGRLRAVVAALEARRRYRDGRGATPFALLQALQGFREELAEAESRLAALESRFDRRTA